MQYHTVGMELSAQKYHPKISFTFPVWQYWLGIAKPKMSPKPYHDF